MGHTGHGSRRERRAKRGGRRGNVLRRATTTLGVAVGLAAVTAVSGVTALVVTAPVASAAPSPSPYYLADPAGSVWGIAGATDYGSMAGHHLNGVVVGITLTPDLRGYWLVGSDGGIFTFGDAAFYGSTGAERLNRPVIGMASTPDGRGYWLFASDGGIFTFGDAAFYGSTGGAQLDQPIVAMTSTADDRGYWEVGAGGKVFPFGDAGYYGDAEGTATAQIAPAAGGGYWEIAPDGDVFPFGSATSQSPPVTALLETSDNPGVVAMEWAMGQQGKPYQWGGAGPASFDCSGLVMRAWQAAGIDIPRVAAAQYDFGTHVPIADLQVGDLVFWASNPADPSTIYHVAMYIGSGRMVNAPYTGTFVGTGYMGGPGFMSLGTRP